MRTTAWTLTVLHVLALLFGLFGILVAIPHPELWSAQPAAAAFFAFVLDKAGGTAMILGAAAMFAYGAWELGLRRTLLFFLSATVISAVAELAGTKTGWPFGGYEYTNFLGYKLLGRVPFPIPLSWFSMGFASFVLADAALAARGISKRAIATVVLATWLLVAWDLVLDPSMASPQMQYVHFWVWHERGPYFGMPLRNLAGWFGTGLLFIALGRALWRDVTPPSVPATLPFVVYAANIAWSMALSLSTGMWPAVIAAIVFALVPAASGLVRTRTARAYA